MLPYLFDLLKPRLSSVGELTAEERIVVVKSPLISLMISLMKDQVAKFSESDAASTFKGGQHEDMSHDYNFEHSMYVGTYRANELICAV